MTATIRRLGFIAVIVGALCAPTTAALALAPPPRLPPGIGVKLLQGPADSVDNPRAHEYIIDHLAPGTTIARQIGVSNGNAQPVFLSFYAVGADIRKGIFEPGTGHATNDLASWTEFSPTTAIVQPGQTLAVKVTIGVPADATAGERYAAALADDTTSQGTGGGVTSVSRVGIRIYLSVGAGGGPKTAFTINSMTAGRDAKGNPLVTATVDNTGGRAVDLSGKLELANGPSSLSAGPFPVRTVATLAPSESGQVTVVLDPDLPNGPWDARLTLVSGLTSEAGAARITFPTAGIANAAPTAVTAAALPRHSSMSLLLAGALAFGALVLLCLVVLLWQHGRNAPTPDRPPDARTPHDDVVVTRRA